VFYKKNSNSFLPIILAVASCSKTAQSTPTPTTAPNPVSTPARFEINATLVTPNATKEANALYQFLRDNYGKKIISGAMTLSSFDEINWLKTNTGKEPTADKMPSLK